LRNQVTKENDASPNPNPASRGVTQCVFPPQGAPGFRAWVRGGPASRQPSGVFSDSPTSSAESPVRRPTVPSPRVSPPPSRMDGWRRDPLPRGPQPRCPLRSRFRLDFEYSCNGMTWPQALFFVLRTASTANHPPCRRSPFHPPLTPARHPPRGCGAQAWMAIPPPTATPQPPAAVTESHASHLPPLFCFTIPYLLFYTIHFFFARHRAPTDVNLLVTATTKVPGVCFPCHPSSAQIFYKTECSSY